LKLFLERVAREGAQVVILQGPFLDFENEEINACQLAYMENGLESFATYEELFKDLVTFIDRELEGVKCKVVLSPSHREVHHFYPLPQPAFPKSLMPLNLKHEFTLAPNPGFVMVNEITFAFANIDTVKELAMAMVVKQETN
jgi:hypothetical protein